MYRSLLPLLLASLGFFLIPFAIGMPLFEWQISEIVTDFPSNYEVELSPSPWSTSLEDALDDGSYILQRVRIFRDGEFCLKENIKFVVRRSQNEKILERLLNPDLKNVSWLFAWSVWGTVELFLSGVYILWFIIEHKNRSAFQAVIVMGIAGFISVFLILFCRLLGPRIGYFGIVDCYGTVTFDARLLKVHYETLIVRCALLLSEVGALGVMVRQIRKVASEEKESSRSAVG